MSDARNDFGFPVVSQQERLQQAQQYAAQARERNKLPCQCPTCRKEALLPAVQNILAARAA